ncbi:MAG TPA: pitrilysin family protein [Methylomirabilota bacterium]|nr:pitrilysin family protein [Methylomirabilota bacterium]
MTRRLIPLVVATAVALAVVPGVPVAAPPIAHREVLPNGVVLLVAERPTVPIVAVRVFMRAGAVFEPDDRVGLANLTGSVLTRGTAGRSGPEIDDAIEFVGGSLEAGAGRDGLTASLSVLRKDLALGLDLLSDVVLAPAFPEAEVKRKVAQIQAAIKRSEENPDTVAARALARLVFPTHPYGRPVEGTIESVGRLTRGDVVAFYQRHVRPDTAIVAVVGDVTVDEARRQVLARFGGWTRPPGPAPTVPPATGQAPPGSATIAKELTQATIMLGRPAVRQVDPDYFPLAVASYVLGGGSASRLYSRVRDEGGLAYAVYSYVSPGRHGASLVVSAQTRVGEVVRVTDILRDELARLGRDPAAADELRLARDYLVGSFPLRLDTTAKVADFIVAIEEQGLGLDYGDRYRAGISKVTAADVQQAAARFFRPDTFSRVVVGAPK